MGAVWCPRCRAEYRPGYDTCADCGVALVEEEPPAPVASAADAPAFRLRPDAFHRHCPRCGAPFPQLFLGEWFETSQRCAECGVAAVDDALGLAPSDAEVAYTLGELTLVERTAVTAELVDREVPYRWEDELVLVVPPTAEALVDRLVDEVSGIDPSSAGQS